jgi:hypothetical protein
MKNMRTKSRMNERPNANSLLAPPRFIDKLDECYFLPHDGPAGLDQDYTWWTQSVGLYCEVFAMMGFRIAS